MKRILRLFLVTALSLNLGAAFGSGPKKGEGFHGKFKNLNLSAEQLEKLKSHRKESREQMKSNRSEIKALREQMDEGFKKNLSDKELEGIHSKLKQKRSEMEDLRFAKLLYLKNLLTEEQRKKFSEFKGEGRGKHKKMQNEKQDDEDE